MRLRRWTGGRRPRCRYLSRAARRLGPPSIFVKLGVVGAIFLVPAIDWTLAVRALVARQSMKAAVVASLLVLITGCYRTDNARWLEQVQSWDGTVFKLEGHAEVPTWFLLPERGPTTFVSYYHRPTGAFWKQDYGYRPLVFDMVKGTPIVILGMDSDGKCYWHGWPTTRLVAYRWSGNGWKETSLSDLPIDKMRANLLTSIYHGRDASKDISGLITLQEKRGRGWLDIPLHEWTVKYGAPCENKVRLDIGPAPIVSGSHGVPIKSSQWGD